MATYIGENMKKTIILFILCVALLGCGTTAGTSAKVGYSGFDKSRTVDVSPHATAGIGTDLGIGVQWNEATKDSVILLMAVFWVYTGITGAELNIDGEKIVLIPTGTVTDMHKTAGIPISIMGFNTQFDIVTKIINSKRTWLRLQTPTGYVEDAVIDGKKDSKAYNALKRFVTAVNGT
jgi:hypothetical protein